MDLLQEASKVCLVFCTGVIYVLVTAVLGFVMDMILTGGDDDKASILLGFYIAGLIAFLVLFIVYLNAIGFF